jgi:hypothetical protein
MWTFFVAGNQIAVGSRAIRKLAKSTTPAISMYELLNKCGHDPKTRMIYLFVTRQDSSSD